MRYLGVRHLPEHDGGCQRAVIFLPSMLFFLASCGGRWGGEGRGLWAAPFKKRNKSKNKSVTLFFFFSPQGDVCPGGSCRRAIFCFGQHCGGWGGVGPGSAMAVSRNESLRAWFLNAQRCSARLWRAVCALLRNDAYTTALPNNGRGRCLSSAFLRFTPALSRAQRGNLCSGWGRGRRRRWQEESKGVVKLSHERFSLARWARVESSVLPNVLIYSTHIQQQAV